MDRLLCPDCHAPMRQIRIVHPNRSSKRYRCDNRQCTAYMWHRRDPQVSVEHYDPLLYARLQAHQAFDPLWRGALTIQPYAAMYANASRNRTRVVGKIMRMARMRAYRWLREQLGIARQKDCHIGAFSQSQCHNVVVVCDGVTAETVHEWWEAQRSGADTGRKTGGTRSRLAAGVLGKAQGGDCATCDLADQAAKSSCGCLCRRLGLG